MPIKCFEDASRRVEHVKAAQQDEGTADLLEDVCTFGPLVPVQVVLDNFGERTCQHDDCAMTYAVKQ